MGRFCEVIRDMTQHSQFILITHSKRTMEAADVLYGVTMETAGISKLVSVELADRDVEPVAVPEEEAVAFASEARQNTRSRPDVWAEYDRERARRKSRRNGSAISRMFSRT